MAVSNWKLAETAPLALATRRLVPELDLTFDQVAQPGELVLEHLLGGRVGITLTTVQRFDPKLVDDEASAGLDCVPLAPSHVVVDRVSTIPIRLRWG